LLRISRCSSVSVNCYAGIGMNVSSAKSIASTVLSLWLGVLACLLGCASPGKAVERAPQRSGIVQCPPNDDAGDSCCQHRGSSEKNRHHAMSCCPTETALTQKQTLAVPALTATYIAVLTLVHAESSPAFFENSHAGDAIPWQSGRDILQQVHILRI
jgi:hypothetical protein